MIHNILKRVGFACLGFFGLMTVPANISFCDSGSKLGMLLASLTLSGSFLNITSGVIGLVIGSYRLPLALAGVGMSLQLSPYGLFILANLR